MVAARVFAFGVDGLELVADRTGELGGDDGERLEAFGARRDEEEPAAREEEPRFDRKEFEGGELLGERKGRHERSLKRGERPWVWA